MRTRPRGLIIAGTVIAAVLQLIIVLTPRSSAPRVLEVEMQTSAGSTAKVYWDTGNGIREADSASAPLERTPDGFQVVRLPIPAHDIRGARFDPIDAPGQISIRRMAVRTADGTTIARLRPESLLPLNHIASMTRHGEVTRIETPPQGANPELQVTAACLAGRSPWYSFRTVTPLSLAAVGLAAIALILGSIVAVAWHVAASRSPRTPTPGVWLWFAGLLLVAMFGKLTLMHYYPSQVPYMDQWPGEAGALYVPYSEGCLSWQQMVALHNEHRVLFTRLLAVGLVAANGQWDPQLQEAENAGIHALTGVLLAAMLWAAGGRRRLDIVVLVCALAFALPFSWENTLAGFQSAFYFQLLFSILGVWLTTVGAAGSFGWTLGWICVLAGTMSAAGGLMTPVAIGAATVLKAWAQRDSVRGMLPTLGGAMLLTAIAAALATPPLAGHASLRAASAIEFTTALARNLAWPWIDHPVIALVMWLPFTTALVLRLARRTSWSEYDAFRIGLGLLIVMQAVAIALTRGAGGQAPASRYMDFMSIGFVLNTLLLIELVDRAGHGIAAYAGRRRVAAAWIVVALIGVYQLTLGALAIGATVRRQWMTEYTASLRQFVITDDLAALATKQFPGQVPYPDPVVLANAWLRHPYVRRILPPAIREPLILQPATNTNQTFVPNGVYPTTPIDALTPRWGSYNSLGNPARGRFESRRFGECDLARLRFDVAGYLREPGLSLSLKRLDTGKTIALVPAEQPMERWLTVNAACPGGAFEVEAIDDNPSYWFAFSNPVEIGWASAMTESLVQNAQGLLFASIGVLVVAARRR